MPAYAYLRKSVTHDTTREVSPAMQEAAVRALAAQHGDEDNLVFLSDWNVSGQKGRDKRPGYDQLLAAIESGQCTAVYSYSLSRLGRSVQELARLVDDLTKRKIPVRLSADPIDTSSATGTFTAHILMAVAQLESDLARERQYDAIAAKRAAGRPIGTAKPYGEKEGEDAQAVMDAFLEAGSYSGAAKLLNDRRIPTRNSKKRLSTDSEETSVWWPSSVAVIVQRLDPKITKKPTTRTMDGSNFTLAKLLRCPTCGTMLTGTRDRLDGPNKGRVRYACRLGTVTPHARVSISEHLILPAIQAEASLLRTPDATRTSDEATEAERAALEAQRIEVLDMAQAGDITRDERRQRLQTIGERLQRLDVGQVLHAIPSIDWSWEPRALNAVLRALFGRIDLDRESFQPVAFHWAVPEWRASTEGPVAERA
jgi:DNA invertase Pin-like site-specific DNA recombinase